MYQTTGSLEKQTFPPFERPDGLLSSTRSFEPSDGYLLLNGKEVYYSRNDGLELVHHSFDRVLMRFDNFKHPEGLRAVIRTPNRMECHWKYRLDGITQSTLVGGRSLILRFADRADGMKKCSATFVPSETSIKFSNLLPVSMRVVFGNEVEEIEYNASEPSQNLDLSKHISTLENHITLCMSNLNICLITIVFAIQERITAFLTCRISVSESECSRSIHDL